MKNDEKIIAEAVRIEYDDSSDELFIVFKVIDPLKKISIRSTWLDDIEYKLINKKIVESE